MLLKRKHRIFKEIYREDGNVYYFFSPNSEEFYLGVGGLIEGLYALPFPFIKPLVFEDYQGLTFIPFPIVYHYALEKFFENESTYNEDDDTHAKIDLSSLAKEILNVSKEHVKSLTLNLLSDESLTDSIRDLIKANEQESLDKYDFVLNKEYLKNSSKTTKTLIDAGSTVFWVQSTPRVRSTFTVKQADGNVFVLTEIREFIPRDIRKNCSFLSMSSVNISGKVAHALITHIEKQGGK